MAESLDTHSFYIGGRRIGPGSPVYIIFEVASTHENDWEVAKHYVDQAAEAGADAVKFQLFRADELLTPLTTGLRGVYDYFKTAETPREWFPKLKRLCDSRGVDLLCTPFDINGASFLDCVGVPAIKIASGELTNLKLLAHVARFGKPVIVSTGMATIAEIRRAVAVLRENGADDIVLLQCVSVYPTSFEDANVSAMRHLQREFEIVVGYSDNGSNGYLVPLLAVTLGASIIEKHVTSMKKRSSIDDKFSLTIEEFGEMVRRIRNLEKRLPKARKKILDELREEYGADFEKAYGDGIKRPAPHGTLITLPGVDNPFVQKESGERHWARRGVYLRWGIGRGEKITEDMLVFLRPDVGICCAAYHSIIGKIAGEYLPSKLPLKLRGDKVFRFHPEDARKLYPSPQDCGFIDALIRYATFN